LAERLEEGLVGGNYGVEGLLGELLALGLITRFLVIQDLTAVVDAYRGD
jgi:hypothetical protein